MSTPSERTQSVESSPLNPSRVPSYLPAILPHPPYVSLLASPQDLFNPLKSLGRLVSNSSNVGPFSYRDLPPMLNPNSLLNDSFIGHLPSPHLLFNRGQHTAPYSKTEANNNSIIRFHPLVPAHHPRGTDSPRSSSSPRRCKALSISTPCIEVKPTRTYHFTEEDLHNVLYGYTQGMDDRRPLHCTAHALSGLRVPPTNTGMDSHTLDRDSLQIPQGLSLIKTVYGDIPKCGVFSTSIIPKGVKFGPFEGKVVNTSEIKTYDDNSLMWEIFEEGKLSHFIDGKGASGNWMSLVNCARFPEEQNLIAIQSDQEIFYECCKEILPRQELLVWYGDCYRQFLGIPVSLKGMDEEKPQYQLPEESAEGYKCERCGKVFAYKYYRDKHLKYTRCVDQGDRKFPCHLCNRSFEKRDRLRIHILHVHEKHRPHKCTVCGKSFSQSSSLNKHMRVHSGERPYKCVYCNKAFTASSILRTHIRQHSGEKPFKCKHCGKAFASHAAHDSHVRRTHNKDKGYTCAVCGKMFQEAEELKYHMQIHSGF